jgi:hypothetical protein
MCFMSLSSRFSLFAETRNNSTLGKWLIKLVIAFFTLLRLQALSLWTEAFIALYMHLGGLRTGDLRRQMSLEFIRSPTVFRRSTVKTWDMSHSTILLEAAMGSGFHLNGQRRGRELVYSNGQSWLCPQSIWVRPDLLCDTAHQQQILIKQAGEPSCWK